MKRYIAINQVLQNLYDRHQRYGDTLPEIARAEGCSEVEVCNRFMAAKIARLRGSERQGKIDRDSLLDIIGYALRALEVVGNEPPPSVLGDLLPDPPSYDPSRSPALRGERPRVSEPPAAPSISAQPPAWMAEKAPR